MSSEKRTISSRIDSITRIGDRLGEVIRAPKSVKIELNSKCNYKCTFCVRSIRRNDNLDMDRAFFSRIIREMRTAGVEELGMFYINESFSCPWLPDAIAEAKEVGFPYVFLTTNGSIANPDKVEACMKAGLNSLKFSLNFADEEQFVKITQVSAKNYPKALENLRLARQVRDNGNYDCGVFASSIAFDGEQGKRMRAIVDTSIKPYVDEFYWLPLYGMSGASATNKMVPSAGNPGRLDAMVDPLPCWSVFTEGHILVDGLLSACCFGAGIEGELNMADLNKVSFMEGWNSQVFQELRRAHMNKDVRGTACEHCIAGTV